jgi:hypothetical protein
MPITVTEDDSERGGYALVDLGALAASPLPRLSIRRQDAEPRQLGLDGWQPDVAWLTPLSAESVGGRTVVRFGPAVVDRIPDEIGVEIVEEGGQSFGIVRWPYITPAPNGLGITFERTAPPSPLPVETIESEPDLPPIVRPEPAPLIEPEPRPSRIEEPRLSVPPAVGQRRKPLGRTIAVLLVLMMLAGGAGTVWLYRDRVPWLSLPGSQGPRSALAELHGEYAALLQRRASAADLLAFGNKAIESGEGTIAFRAFEEADPGASEEAAWQLARFYDPRVTSGPTRAAAAPNASWAAYYHALWKGRSTRHTDELRTLCGLDVDSSTRERMRVFCQA